MYFCAVLSAFFLLSTVKAQYGLCVYKAFTPITPGFYFEYYPSGKLKVEGIYLRDTVPCVCCYEEFSNHLVTKPISTLMRVGEWKEFYESGQVKAQGNYYGIHEIYSVEWPMRYNESSNGLVPGSAEQEYVKDKFWYYYSEQGHLVRIEYYYKGMLASYETYKD